MSPTISPMNCFKHERERIKWNQKTKVNFHFDIVKFLNVKSLKRLAGHVGTLMKSASQMCFLYAGHKGQISKGFKIL